MLYSEPITQRRQVLYWRMLSAMFGFTDHANNMEQMARTIADELGIPALILDPHIAIDTLLHRYPELVPEFESIDPVDGEPESATLRRALVLGKLLLNVFGPNTQTSQCSAQQYAEWLKDVERLERALGCPKGSLRGSGSAGAGAPGGSTGNQGAGHNEPLRPGEDKLPGTGGSTGSGFDLSPEDIRQAIQGLESDLIKRMALREVLKDDRLAAQLTPSMPLMEQLLRDKGNLSGNALVNAKRLIRQYIDELAEVLRLQVQQVVSPKIDRSVPPKRTFRNLDLERTIWKNLINWNPDERRLYVDRLYYKPTGRKKLPSRLIVVVDQSGSMVNAMVQCTILASIFAGLPHVDVHLIAYDTRVLDLTPWVQDPFEVLLRTRLGGGNDDLLALQEAAKRIESPRHTAFVWISDFYTMGASQQVILDFIRSLKDSGVHVLPVGSVQSSGYVSINEWYRTHLKAIGLPVLTGTPRKLIEELKKVIMT